jgi:integrase
MATIIKRGDNLRVQIRRAGFPTESQSFKRKEYPSAKAVRDAAKAWARQRDAELNKTTPKRVAASKGRTVRHALDRYARKSLGVKMVFDDQSLSPREALKWADTIGDNVTNVDGRARTWRERLALLEFWDERIGNIQLIALDTDDIESCLEELEGRSNKTIDGYLSTLRTALEVVVGHKKWIEYNIAKSVDLLGGYQARDRVFDDEEVAAIIKALDGVEPLQLMTRIANDTGLRQGSILDLLWSNVTLSDGAIFVPRTKNDEPITTRVKGETLNALKAWARIRKINDDHIFPAARGFNRMAFPKKEWQAALDAAGIQRDGDPTADKDKDPKRYWGARFHDLRHTCATRLGNKGASEMELMAVLGHKTSAMVARYVKRDLTTVDAAFARLES